MSSTRFIRFEWAAMRARNLLVVWNSVVAATCIGCGTAPTSAVSPKIDQTLTFSNPILDFGASKAGVIDHVFKFDVTADYPVKIVKFQKSCSCITIVSDLLGKTLEPGKEYEMRVQVNLADRTNVAVRAGFTLDDGTKQSILIFGVSETVPVANQVPIHCVYENRSDPSSGLFEVHSIRHVTSEPIVPAKTSFESKHVRVTYLDRREGGSMKADKHVYAVRDIFRWKWELTSPPDASITEDVEIEWLEGRSPPTTIKFALTESLLVPGWVKELRFGSLKPGGTWSHTLTLHTPVDGKFGAVTSAASNADWIGARLEKKKDYTFIHIEVRLPAETDGRDFRGDLKIQFEKDDPALQPIRIIGSASGEVVPAT